MLQCFQVQQSCCQTTPMPASKASSPAADEADVRAASAAEKESVPTLDKSPSPAPTEPINYQDDGDDGGQENRHAPPDDRTFAGNKRNRSPEEESRAPEENRPPLVPVSTLHYIQHHLLGREEGGGLH